MKYEKLGPGKYSDNVQRYLHELSLDGGADETGDVSTIGWHASLVVLQDDERAQLAEAGHGYENTAAAVVIEDEQGFITVETYGSEQEAQEAFQGYEKDYAKFGGDEDPDPDADVEGDDASDPVDIPAEEAPEDTPPEEDVSAEELPPEDAAPAGPLASLEGLYKLVVTAMNLRRAGEIRKALAIEAKVDRLIRSAKAAGYGDQAETVELMAHSGEDWPSIVASLRDDLPGAAKTEAVLGQYDREVLKLKREARTLSGLRQQPFHVIEVESEDGREASVVSEDDIYELRVSGTKFTKLYTADPNFTAGALHYMRKLGMGLGEAAIPPKAKWGNESDMEWPDPPNGMSTPSQQEAALRAVRLLKRGQRVRFLVPAGRSLKYGQQWHSVVGKVVIDSNPHLGPPDNAVAVTAGHGMPHVVNARNIQAVGIRPGTVGAAKAGKDESAKPRADGRCVCGTIHANRRINPSCQKSYDREHNSLVLPLRMPKGNSAKSSLSKKDESVALLEGMEVAKEILRQLGGNKFIAMTGARNFVGSPNSLSFGIGRNSGGVTGVNIVLMPSDTYKVTFLGRMVQDPKLGMHRKVIEEVDDIYNDALQDVFTRVTGMYTSLGTMGRKPPPESPAGPEQDEAKTESEDRVIRRPISHQSQCDTCGREGRVYEYGKKSGDSVTWAPGTFCGKGCYLGYHDPAIQVESTKESEVIDKNSPAGRVRTALRLAAGGREPTKIVERLLSGKIVEDDQESLFMVIQPDDKISVAGPDGQTIAGVSIRKTDDGTGWVLDVDGANGLATKDTVVSVDSPVADIDAGMPDDTDIDFEMPSEVEFSWMSDVEPDEEPPAEAGPSEVDVEEIPAEPDEDEYEEEEPKT